MGFSLGDVEAAVGQAKQAADQATDTKKKTDDGLAISSDTLQKAKEAISKVPASYKSLVPDNAVENIEQMKQGVALARNALGKVHPEKVSNALGQAQTVLKNLDDVKKKVETGLNDPVKLIKQMELTVTDVQSRLTVIAAKTNDPVIAAKIKGLTPAKLTAQLQQLQQTFEKLEGAMKEVNPSQIEKTLEQVSAPLRNMKLPQAKFSEEFHKQFDQALEIEKHLKDTSEALVDKAKKAEELMEKSQKFIGGLQDAAGALTDFNPKVLLKKLPIPKAEDTVKLLEAKFNKTLEQLEKYPTKKLDEEIAKAQLKLESFEKNIKKEVDAKAKQVKGALAAAKGKFLALASSIPALPCGIEVPGLDQIEDAVEDTIDDISDKVDDVEDTIDNTLDDVVDKVEDAVDDVKDNVEDAIEDVEDKINDVVDEVEDKIEDAAEEIDEKVEEAVDEITKPDDEEKDDEEKEEEEKEEEEEPDNNVCDVLFPADDEETDNCDELHAEDPGVEEPEEESQTYTVVKGDSLSLIAKYFYGDPGLWYLIWETNESVVGENWNLIYPGQKLTIPPLDSFSAEQRAKAKQMAPKWKTPPSSQK